MDKLLAALLAIMEENEEYLEKKVGRPSFFFEEDAGVINCWTGGTEIPRFTISIKQNLSDFVVAEDEYATQPGEHIVESS